MIRKIIPAPVRRLFRFVFKAPQRKWIGFRSLFTDLRAYLSAWKQPSTIHRITICVGVKNRSRHLIDHLVKSMDECDYAALLDLSVFDCGSDDTDNLELALYNRKYGRIFYSREVMPFARSNAFNRAVQAAESPLVLICDADMSLPRNIVKKVNRYANRKSAWFPVVRYLNEDGSSRWYTESTGMMACRKEDYFKAGGMDENIREWGKEDWLLLFSFYKIGIGCIRTYEPNFVHHWHPSLKPEDFKPLF